MLPRLTVRRNAKFQSEISEQVDTIFPMQVKDPLDSIKYPRGPSQIQSSIQQLWGGLLAPGLVCMSGGGEVGEVAFV